MIRAYNKTRVDNASITIRFSWPLSGVWLMNISFFLAYLCFLFMSTNPGRSSQKNTHTVQTALTCVQLPLASPYSELGAGNPSIEIRSDHPTPKTIKYRCVFYSHIFRIGYPLTVPKHSASIRLTLIKKGRLFPKRTGARLMDVVRYMIRWVYNICSRHMR